MKLSTLAGALLAAPALAHHVVTNFYVNGVDQGMGRCMRTPLNTNPVMDFGSNEMACNVNGDKGVARVCEVDAGDSLTFVWRAWPDGREPGSITPNHVGPCTAYLKRAPDSTSVTQLKASGGGWFKIWHDGFKDGKWCSDRVIANGGNMRFSIPSDIAPGEYILRVEQLALHQAYRRGGVQPYIGCAQIIISSNGQKTVPSPIVSIPGHWKDTDAGILFDVYKDPKPEGRYPVPGPKIFWPPPQPGRILNRLKEKGDWDSCFTVNANWCARALGGYKSEFECWEGIRYCYRQLDTCYKTAPFTGHKGCGEYSDYCHSMEAVCKKCVTRECNGGGVFPNPPKQK